MFFHRKPLPLKRLAELEADIADLRRQFDRLSDDHIALNMKHHKLSGRFYSRFGQSEASEQPLDDKTLTKAQLRAKLGLFPGRSPPKIG